MTFHRAAAAASAIAIAVVGGGGVVLALSGGTTASFTDDEHSSPSQTGAASVVLGRGGAGPDLDFGELQPDSERTVALRIVYQGTVPAEVSLSVTPDGESALCQQSGGAWTAQPQVPVTVTVGSAPSVSYCALYDGRRLPLGQVRPGEELTVPVTVMLTRDAGVVAAGREELDSVTVHADGGFTDSATGPLTLTTADVRDPSFRAAPPAVLLAVTDAAPTLALDPADPAATARTVAPGATVTLPEECTAAGIDPASIVEVVALDPADPVWDATLRRGAGAGPFLVLGTRGADTVVGSGLGDCVVTGDGADRVSGGDGADVVLGGAGDDLLAGDDGADRLIGGSGSDDLRGGLGADVLDGGSGGAVCDTAPGDTALGCRPVPVPPSAVVAPPVASPDAPAPAPVVPVAPVVPPAPAAPPAPAPAAPEPAPPVEEPPAREPAAPDTEDPAPVGPEPAPPADLAPAETPAAGASPTVDPPDAPA